MENFIVSARKYRPSSFKAVVGQQSLTTTLKNAIQRKQLAQAYLFCGPRGVGKTTCARIFAKTINCLNPTAELEACNECESCLAFIGQRSFNIHELDAASNNSVEGIRKLIDQVRIPPQISKYSVYIIDEVHMLSSNAFNAFLKTLEEPPAHAIFILATTEKHKILPTILSRCQIYDFNRIKVEDTVKYIEHIAKAEGVSYEIEALNIIAQKADGAMRDALSIFDQVVSYSDNNITYQKVIENLNVLDFQYYFSLTENFLHADYTNSLRVFDELLSKGFDTQQFITGLSNHLRNLLICKDPQTVQLLEVGAAIAEKYIKFSSQCAPEFLIKALDMVNQTDVTYRQSSNQRLHVELMLIRLCGLNQEKKNNLFEGLDSQDFELSVLVEDKPREYPKVQEISTIQEPKVNDSPKTSYVPKGSPKTISIKQAIEGKPADAVIQTKSQPQENFSDDENIEDDFEIDATSDYQTPITQKDIENQWQNFIRTHLSAKPRYASLLSNYSPLLESDQIISIEFESQLQVDLFNEIKNDLILFLRRTLDSKGLTINSIINVQENGKNKLYTVEDKFKFLSEQNPKIINLKQQLNLDFD